MNKLKVCFIGVGSIACRHIRNLKEICEQQNVELIVDALRRKNSKPLENIELNHVYMHEEELEDDYDAIFITTPTDFHMDNLTKLHSKSRNFFIEKPLTSLKKLDAVESFVCREGITYYVACPLRYTSVIQYLKNNIRLDQVRGVRCICSSYLPDWRPGVDYRNTYSADKELGGGVSIDLIHEWDYIKYLFGTPNDISYTCGKVSSLELNCEDYATYAAVYKDKIIELHLDYFGRESIREIMIFTENDTIIGDLIHSTVTYLKEGKKIEFGENRDDYQKSELLFFLGIMDGKAKSSNDIWDAYRTMKLTQGEVKE